MNKRLILKMIKSKSSNEEVIITSKGQIIVSAVKVAQNLKRNGTLDKLKKLEKK